MAFGFSAKHTEIYNLNSLTKEQFLVIALEAAKNNNWKIGQISENGFFAYSKFSMSSWGEEILVKIDEDKALLKSKCTGNQIVDWGKNKQNVNLLLAGIKKFKREIISEDFLPKYEALKPSLNSEEIGNEIKTESFKEKIISFFSIFVPAKRYFITPIIINLNILVFIVMCISGANVMTPDNESLLLWGANFKPMTLDGEWWRLITNFFLHIGLFHLLFNMYALVYIGLLLEPYLGKARFLSAYLLAGLFASIASLWWHDLTISAGASGAIFGMYGVFLAMLTTNFIDKAARTALLTSIGLFVGYNLLSGLNGEIDNAAHIGGLISGIVIGYAFYPSLKSPNLLKLKNSTIVVLSVLFIGISVLVYANSSNDIGIYESQMQEFVTNENKALEVFKLNNDATDKEYLTALSENGISYWRKNIELIKDFEKLELPSEIEERNLKLIQYCHLRIDSYQLIYKAIEEDTEVYQSEIEEINLKIEAIINDF